MHIPMAACHSGSVGGSLLSTPGDVLAYFWLFRSTASPADLLSPSGYAVRSPGGDTDGESLWSWLIFCHSTERTEHLSRTIGS